MANCPNCGRTGTIESFTKPVTGAAKGAAAGAAVGSLIPVIGTGIGAAVGGFLGFLDGTREYQCPKCKHTWKD